MMTRYILTGMVVASCLSANGQCYPERHNSNWNEGWLSCEMRLNPNTTYGDGHWIMYDFGHSYALGQMHVWNYNASDWVDMGVREMSIDISADGKHWINKGQHLVERAPGHTRYEGDDLYHFHGDTARYVLLTALNNHGGSCVGLGEVKFEVLGHKINSHTLTTNTCFDLSLYPNPHVEQFALNVRTRCAGPLRYSLYDHTGKLVMRGQKESSTVGEQWIIATGTLTAGIYHLVMEQDGNLSRYPIVKMQR